MRSKLSESKLHIELVKILADWICHKSSYLGDDKLVFIDSPYSLNQELPRKLGDYRPDILAYDNQTQRSVIGEAKTARDLNSSRSHDQIRSFLSYAYSDKQAVFILATQWDAVRYAYNLIKTFSNGPLLGPVNFGVLDQFGELRAHSDGWI